MNQILYRKDFLKKVKKLPVSLQRKLADLLELLASQPFHPLLHTKMLGGKLAGLYSFRITRDWRVLFQFNSPDIIQIITVDHRKDIYR